MGSGYHGPYYAGRKDMHFPPDSVESTQPLMNKRKRLTKNDIGNCFCLGSILCEGHICSAVSQALFIQVR